MPDRERIDACVEAICQQGCRSVLSTIEVLEGGGGLPETQGLDTEQVQRVLRELKSIMSIYERPCDV